MPEMSKGGEELVVFAPNGEVRSEPVADLGTFRQGPPPPLPDRGSRAETVAYGGGLRTSPRRVIGALVAALVLVGLLVASVYLVNAESANSYSAVIVPANLTELNFPGTGPLQQVLVADGEAVHKGQVLAIQADPAARIALYAARLEVKAAQAHLGHLLAELRPPSPRLIASWQAQLSSDQSELAGLRAASLSEQELLAAAVSADASVLASSGSLYALSCGGPPGHLVHCASLRLDVARAKEKLASDKVEAAILAGRASSRELALQAAIATKTAALAAALAAGSPPRGAARDPWSLQQARAQLAEAKVHLAMEEATVANLYLRAPIAGRVLRIAGAGGQIVGPDGIRSSVLSDPAIPTANVFRLFPQSGASGAAAPAATPVVTLVRGRRWEVLAQVPESAIGTVRIGSPATFSFQDMSGQIEPCSVAQILPEPLESGGTIQYEVVLLLRSPAPPGVLPGMSGVAKLG